MLHFFLCTSFFFLIQIKYFLQKYLPPRGDKKAPWLIEPKPRKTRPTLRYIRGPKYFEAKFKKQLAAEGKKTTAKDLKQSIKLCKITFKVGINKFKKFQTFFTHIRNNVPIREISRQFAQLPLGYLMLYKLTPLGYLYQAMLVFLIK